MATEFPPLANVGALIGQYTSSKKEVDLLEEYADLYAILKSTEKLERAYVRDAISARDYEPACQRLIAHYRTLWETVRESVPSLQAFMATYGMQCPMAARRLAQSGMPATVEHGSAGAAKDAGYTAAVADAVGQFITTMDALKLNMAAVDQVFPLLSDLTQSLNKVPTLPPDLPGRTKLKAWVSKLHGLPASYELNEAESRQLLFELEGSYNEFMAHLPR